MSFLTTALVGGTAFGLMMAPVYWAAIDGQAALVLGPTSGLFFGLGAAGFAAWQRSRVAGVVPDLEDGERLLMDGPANHFRPNDAAGGWLYLTDRRLLFRPHRFNRTSFATSVPLAAVTGVEPCRTARVFPNGLRVTTADGAERFVVEGRRGWAGRIAAAAASAT